MHPTGGVIARLGTMTQGQGHATTYAQIIATELGLPASDIVVEEGDTDKAPYGAGTWGSRSTPVSGAATALAARKIKDKAKKIAAHLLEVAEGDLEWEIDRFKVKGNPTQAKTMKEICMVSHTGNLPAGMEQGLNAVAYYDPPNLTFPFGAYLCVVDIDKFTGEVKVRRFYALDDCGTRINPMIIEGQIHGGLTEAFAVAMGQQIPFDENGNHLGNSLMDYFLPTAMETPHWETDHTVTPCPHHPIGAKGVAESPHVGGIPCFSNAVIDAFAHLGVTHMDMPHSALPRLAEVQRAGRQQAIGPLRVTATPTMKVQLEKSYPMPASADAAWALLQDIEGVAGCMPGAKITERIDDAHYKGTVAVKVGPASLSFRGEVEVRGSMPRRARCACSARAPTPPAARPRRWT